MVRANLQDNCEIVGGSNGVTTDNSANSAGDAHTTISHCTIHYGSGVAVEANGPSGGGRAVVMVANSAVINNTNSLSADGAKAYIALNNSFIASTGVVSNTTSGGTIATFSNNGVSGYATFGAAFSPQPLQ